MCKYFGNCISLVLKKIKKTKTKTKTKKGGAGFFKG